MLSDLEIRESPVVDPGIVGHGKAVNEAVNDFLCTQASVHTAARSARFLTSLVHVRTTSDASTQVRVGYGPKTWGWPAHARKLVSVSYCRDGRPTQLLLERARFYSDGSSGSPGSAASIVVVRVGKNAFKGCIEREFRDDDGIFIEDISAAKSGE